MPPQTIGRLKAFHGNFGMHVRAYAYIRSYGSDSLRDLAPRRAQRQLRPRPAARHYHMPYDRLCAHEFVMEGHFEGVEDVHALDISKRLMDYGIHPPTNYFPLIVPEALLIEPTETEDKDTLDNFVTAMKTIAKEAHDDAGTAARRAPRHAGQAAGRSPRRQAARPLLPPAARLGVRNPKLDKITNRHRGARLTTCLSLCA